jgi:hypothetical protein
MARARGTSMTPDDLKARTKKLAVDVIRFAKAVPQDAITGATKLGPRRSRRISAFVSFVADRLRDRRGNLWNEADELTRILVRSRETARFNHQSSNRQ